MPLISKPFQVSYRGVASSSSLNAWMADLHADLSEIFHQARTQEQALQHQNALWLTQHAYLRAEILRLKRQLDALASQQAGTDRIHYVAASEIASSAEPVTGFPACELDSELSVLTAHVEARVSKMYVRDLTGEVAVPRNLTYRLYERWGELTGWDAPNPNDFTQVTDAPDLARALDGRSDTAFFRAPSGDTQSVLGILLEIALPTTVVSHRKLNRLTLHPALAYAFDWKYAATSSNGSTWSQIDLTGYGDVSAWKTEARRVGPFGLYFPAIEASHLRLGFEQRYYLTVDSARYFPYGFRHIEASYVRYSEGLSKIRFLVDPPRGNTVSWRLTAMPEVDAYPGAEPLPVQMELEDPATNQSVGVGDYLTGALRVTLGLYVAANRTPVLRGLTFRYATT